MKNKLGAVKEWINHGTKGEVFLRRILVVGLVILILYNFGYAVGTLFAHLGF